MHVRYSTLTESLRVAPCLAAFSWVVLSLGIFSGTYFAYLSRYETHALGSYFPLAIGVSSFFLLMSVVADRAVSSQTRLGRIAKAVGLALVATAVFLLLFLFLVLNTLGS